MQANFIVMRVHQPHTRKDLSSLQMPRMTNDGKPATAKFYWTISVISTKCVWRTCLRQTYLFDVIFIVDI